MSGLQQIEEKAREPLLHPVDRVSELIFGLFMALTFVGVVSMATADRQEIQTMLYAALGCNIAWGLVDGFMYLVRTITDRGRLFTLARSIRGADPVTGRRILHDAVSSAPAGKLLTAAEIEVMHGRLLALPDLPARPRFQRNDFLAAFGVFVIVVASTFPVALPFVFIEDPASALFVSRAIGVSMMFLAGLALGRYAGYGSWKTGFMMAGLGTVVVAAVVALGG
jgi:VIT1/CCC1 family predicted Fe2+/Mn2+ transporter